MAVNVSALEAQHASLGDDVRRVLNEQGLAPRDLVLELTEKAMLQAATSTLATLRRLREVGVGDRPRRFGTGYASPRHLAMLAVSAVKVDLSFTSGLPDDETSKKSS